MNEIEIIEFKDSTFHQKYLDDLIGTFNMCQENEQYNNQKGILRGLHYQVEPYQQAKLIRVVKGAILSVAVDLRKHSDEYASYVSYELDDIKREQMFVPKGYAHGYITLSEESVVIYKVDEYFNLEAMRGILFSDKTLNIDWRINKGNIVISQKDANNSPFKKETL